MVKVLPTTVVDSYPQPDRLVYRAMLGSRLPPRTRALEIWRVAPEFLEQAHDASGRCPTGNHLRDENTGRSGRVCGALA